MMYTLTIYYVDQRTKEGRTAKFSYGTIDEAFENYHHAIKKSEVRLARIYRGNQEIFMWHKNIIC